MTLLRHFYDIRCAAEPNGLFTTPLKTRHANAIVGGAGYCSISPSDSLGIEPLVVHIYHSWGGLNDVSYVPFRRVTETSVVKINASLWFLKPIDHSARGEQVIGRIHGYRNPNGFCPLQQYNTVKNHISNQ